MASSRTQRSHSCIERGEVSFWCKLRAMLIAVASLALVTGPARAQLNDEAGEASTDTLDLEGMFVTLQSDYDELKAKFDQLTASRRDLDSRYTALEKAQEELQAMYAQLSSSNVALPDNYAALEQAYTQAHNENTQLRLSIHARGVTVRTAAERMVDRTVTSASRNLSSVAGQAADERSGKREGQVGMTSHGLTCGFVMLALTTAATAQSMYKCTTPTGVVYQQAPCMGTGKRIVVEPASGPASGTDRPVVEDTPRTQPPVAPTPATSEAPVKSDLPATPPPEARGRLDGWPKSDDGLAVGMSPNAVIRAWGRPHEIVQSGSDGMFFHYCDMRTALIWKGQLASWSALFDDSKRGAHSYVYGQPWREAAQKWGVDRERKAFMYAGGERGDVQTWSQGKWIVTDQQGNIVSWCDAADHRGSTPPPTHRTAWE